MKREDHPVHSAQPAAAPGPSRRGLLRGAGGIGIAGVAAGILVDTTAGGASAATVKTTSAGRGPVPASASGPLVAHVHDARTGEVDLYIGERHVRVHDRALARALAQAATADFS